MHLVLEARVLAARQQLGVVRDDVGQRLDPVALALGKIAEHVRVHHLLDAGMADADPHPAVVVADMRGDRAQPVVAGDAAAGLHPHLARRQFELVVEHDDVGQRQLVEMHRLGDRASGLVHEGAGQQQLHALAAERPFRATP